MQPLKEVQKSYSSAKKLLGLGGSKWIVKAIGGNFIFNILTYTFETFTTKEGTLQQIHIAMITGMIYCLSLFFLSLVNFTSRYDDCLQWCNRFHQKLAFQDPKVRKCFESCGKTSAKLFCWTTFNVPVVLNVCILLQALIQGAIQGRFLPLQEIHFPFLGAFTESLVWRVFLIFIQLSGSFVCIFSVMLYINITVMTINYVMAIFDALKVLLSSSEVKGDMNKDDMVKCAVDMHSDLMDRVDILIELSQMPLMLFEANIYCVLLLFWVAVFFNHQLFLVVFGANGMFALYIWIVVKNEQLIEANEKFRLFLYDLEWYRLEVGFQKKLLLIMVMTDRLNFVKVGPYHLMNYEELGNMFNRVYQYGLIINDFLK